MGRSQGSGLEVEVDLVEPGGDEADRDGGRDGGRGGLVHDVFFRRGWFPIRKTVFTARCKIFLRGFQSPRTSVQGAIAKLRMLLPLTLQRVFSAKNLNQLFKVGFGF